MPSGQTQLGRVGHNHHHNHNNRNNNNAGNWPDKSGKQVGFVACFGRMHSLLPVRLRHPSRNPQFRWNHCLRRRSNQMPQQCCLSTDANTQRVSQEKEAIVLECQCHSDEGSCGAQFVRWFWNGEARICESFAYSGCGGNGNNFASREECLSICHREGILLVIGLFDCWRHPFQRLATNWALTRPRMFAIRT